MVVGLTAFAMVAAIGVLGRTTNASAQSFREYPVSTPCSCIGGITSAPDGALWFTLGRMIGRITTAGEFKEFPVPHPVIFGGIAQGPDGALWFTQASIERYVGRIAMDGVVTEYALPDRPGLSSAIAAGSDGAMWFTEPDLNKIGRVAMTGKISEFAIPTDNSKPSGIALGPDGAMWFTEIFRSPNWAYHIRGGHYGISAWHRRAALNYRWSARNALVQRDVRWDHNWANCDRWGDNQLQSFRDQGPPDRYYVLGQCALGNRPERKQDIADDGQWLG